MFSILDLIAILFGLNAMFGWLNHRFLPMTQTDAVAGRIENGER